MITYTDNTLMPFGQHQGIELGKVPAHYLLWCLKEKYNLSPSLKAYIEQNKKKLEQEAKRAAKFNSR